MCMPQSSGLRLLISKTNFLYKKNLLMGQILQNALCQQEAYAKLCLCGVVCRNAPPGCWLFSPQRCSRTEIAVGLASFSHRHSFHSMADSQSAPPPASEATHFHLRVSEARNPSKSESKICPKSELVDLSFASLSHSLSLSLYISLLVLLNACVHVCFLSFCLQVCVCVCVCVCACGFFLYMLKITRGQAYSYLSPAASLGREQPKAGWGISANDAA